MEVNRVHWSSKFVGIPWQPGGRDMESADCYGLVALVYADAGIALDPLSGLYTTAEERADIAKIVAGERANGPWVQIEPDKVRDLDLLLFSRGGFESHVGIVCGRGLMLHATAGKTSSIERYRDFMPGLVGAWRHKRRA
jgi:cell wall-associated NlpC family hydrolase